MNEDKVKVKNLKKAPGKGENRPDKKESAIKTATSDTGKSISGFIEKGKQFFREVRIESKKVVWPSRKELVSTTIVVVVLVIIIATFLGIVDMALAKLVGLLLK